MCVRMYVCVYVCVYMYVCMCACMYVCVFTAMLLTKNDFVCHVSGMEKLNLRVAKPH